MPRVDVDEFEYFHRTIIEGFMVHDIQAAIEGKANFLAALGLLSYSEVLGWLTTGGKVKNERAFYAFIRGKSLFPPGYRALPDRNPSAYGLLRNNLVHTYGLTLRGNIQMLGASPTGCGIEVTQTDGKPEVHVYVEQFFNDFKKAVRGYRNEVVGTTDGDWAQNFQRLLPKLDKKAWHPQM